MKKRMISTLVLSGLLALSLQILFVLPVSASPLSVPKIPPVPPPVPAPTKLVFAAPKDANLSDPFVLIGTLKDQTGVGIPDKSITFSILGDFLGQTPTKEDGSFRLQVNKDLPAGAFWVTASFNGAHLLTPSNAFAVLNIHPAEVKVQTVPPVAGITFKMDGRPFVSGENGMANIQIYKTGIYRLDVLIDQYHAATQQVSFGRWSEESYDPFRDVRVPTTEVVQVGLNIFHQISQKYVDLDGYPVDPQRISGITIKSAQGDIFNLENSQPKWLPASRTARRELGLEETQLQYSVISVMIDGSNVVNQAQQRFFANPNDSWPISLLLYTLHIDAKDGLFGAPVGKTVDVEFPDGQLKSYPLDKSGTIEIHSLARGIYHIGLTGTNGLNSNIPVALSRNQDVSVKVITYLDMGVVGCIGVAFALGLILYGRPWLLKLFLKKKQSSTQEARWTSIHEN
jgi:hypothetical protein